MKERLQQLLDMEHLTPSRFADLIGVQRSSVSHVLSGRNNPSYDFIHKTLKAFPGLKADWLLLGSGQMYEHMGRDMTGELFGDELEMETGQQAQKMEEHKESASHTAKVEIFPETEASERPLKEESDTEDEEVNLKSGRIVQVMVLYDDGTFTAFKPAD
jgi:transcriptional regulator with XRE-family HTH domain